MTPRCPQCRVDLRPVTVPARLGYLLPLDQCPHCGGIWCDRWEVFPLDAAAVARIDPVDTAALAAPVPPPDAPRECPRCRAGLRRFRDPNLPADVRIERCPNCEGMWFNRGELQRFRSRPRAGEGPPPGEHGSRGGTAPPTVRDLGATLSDPEPVDEPLAELRDGLVGAAIWTAVRAVLRLLLGG